MANLGAVGTPIATYNIIPLVPVYQPVQAVLYPTGGAGGGSSQAIYRWNGTDWEKIKVSSWNGTAWVLV